MYMSGLVHAARFPIESPVSNSAEPLCILSYEDEIFQYPGIIVSSIS